MSGLRDPDDCPCAVCAAYGIETVATTMQREIRHDGAGGLVRAGEPRALCADCAAEGRRYPLADGVEAVDPLEGA